MEREKIQKRGHGMHARRVSSSTDRTRVLKSLRGLRALVVGTFFLLFLREWVVLSRAAEVATYRSLDGGRSWVRTDSGLPREARINGFGSTGGVILAATDAGVFASLDEGENWSKTGETNTVAARPLCVASTEGLVYLGTERGGVLLSRDLGKSWHPTSEGLPSMAIRSLLKVEDALLAGTDRAGVFRSIDDGKNWTNYSEGLPAHAQIHEMAALGGNVYAALYGKGLYRRASGDPRWRRMGEVVPLVLTTVEDALIVGHNPGGIHWSTDGGEHWTIASDAMSLSSFTQLSGSGALSSEAPVWAMASIGRHAFAGASDGVFFSTDKGKTWTRAEGGLPSNSPGIAFLANSRFVLATTILSNAVGVSPFK